MNSEELRIGNYIQHNGREVKVHSITNAGIGIAGFEAAANGPEEAFIKYDEAAEISLTERSLFNLGFEDIGGDDSERTFVYKDNRRIKIKVHQTDLIHLELANNYWGQIKAVHNLQNLYYILIGEDLVAT